MSSSNRLNNSRKKLTADGDVTVLGHAQYGEMKACAESVASGTGRHPQLVRGKPGTMWPCYLFRNVGTITDNVVSASPVKFGYLLEQNKAAAPLYLVGYIGEEPVYESTSRLAMDYQGQVPGPYQWCSPEWMPGMLVTNGCPCQEIYKCT